MAQENLHLILGLGTTGVSCASFLDRKNIPIILIDDHISYDNEDIKKYLSRNILYDTQNIPNDIINQVKVVVKSPGIPNSHNILKKLAKDIPVISDIELFAKATSKPIIAVSGTNGKSTVTTLLGEMFQSSGKKIAVGGNVGTPALELLDLDVDLYILELSSFQLETTFSLKPDCACILNLSPDHLDRHITFKNYIDIKRKLYRNAEFIVFNRQDQNTLPKVKNIPAVSFGSDMPQSYNFGLLNEGNDSWLVRGTDKLLSVKELSLLGKHNWLNILASFAIGFKYNLPLKRMKEAISQFKGLSHRCQIVKKEHGITWINDSKATNVGSLVATVQGLDVPMENIILIVGGQAKEQNFTILSKVLKNIKKLIILGEARDLIYSQITDTISSIKVNGLAEALEVASNIAKKGDIVLLSPACASFDLFKNYIHRGEVFNEMVNNL